MAHLVCCGHRVPQSFGYGQDEARLLDLEQHAVDMAAEGLNCYAICLAFPFGQSFMMF
jgi:hypothetical protein